MGCVCVCWAKLCWLGRWICGEWNSSHMWYDSVCLCVWSYWQESLTHLSLIFYKIYTRGFRHEPNGRNKGQEIRNKGTGPSLCYREKHTKEMCVEGLNKVDKRLSTSDRRRHRRWRLFSVSQVKRRLLNYWLCSSGDCRLYRAELFCVGYRLDLCCVAAGHR